MGMGRRLIRRENMYDWKPDPSWASNDTVKAEIATVGRFLLCAIGPMNHLYPGDSASWDLFILEGGEGHRRCLDWGYPATLEDAKAAAEKALGKHQELEDARHMWGDIYYEDHTPDPDNVG
jgi:hypothetical protein